MKITVKIHPHNSEEVQAVASVLLALAGGMKANEAPVSKPQQPQSQPKTTSAVKPIAEPPKPPAIKAEVKVPEPAKAEETQAPAPAAEGSEITVETLRAKTSQKIQGGHRDAIKNFLVEFGAPNVTGLKPEDYSSFNEKLDSLQ